MKLLLAQREDRVRKLPHRRCETLFLSPVRHKQVHRLRRATGFRHPEEHRRLGFVVDALHTSSCVVVFWRSAGAGLESGRATTMAKATTVKEAIKAFETLKMVKATEAETVGPNVDANVVAAPRCGAI